jgi:hypothetical protein
MHKDEIDLAANFAARRVTQSRQTNEFVVERPAGGAFLLLPSVNDD